MRRIMPTALAVLLTACTGGPGAPPAAPAPPVDGLPDPAAVTSVRLTAAGGRVAWNRGGGGHERIAFDRVVDTASQATDVFLMQPDGSGTINLTAALTAIPRGFIGQPEWHPDGEHLVVQAENAASAHTRFNHMSWGIDQDLWLLRRDGSRAERIFSPGRHGAALHPRISPDGRTLVFAERVATGIVVPSLVGVTPGGENPWTGWRLHAADLAVEAGAPAVLSNHRILRDLPGGFLEPGSFTADGWLVHARTDGGAAYVDDLDMVRLADGAIRAVVADPAAWDEHGAAAPGGRLLAFMSSRADPAWRPGSGYGSLSSEIFLAQAGGGGWDPSATAAAMRLTRFNDGGRRCVVSDLEWDRDGRRLVCLVVPRDEAGAAQPGEIWLIDLGLPPRAAG